MIKLKSFHFPRLTYAALSALLWNLAVVFIAYTLCRLVFLITNWGAYSDTLTWSHAFNLFTAGLRFDTSAILYTNLIILLMILFPLHWKERPTYYKVIKWLYVVINSVCIATNLIDCVYFQFTGKRTTISVLQEFSHEGLGNMANIFWEQFLVNWYLVLLFIVMVWGLWKLFRAPRLDLQPSQKVFTLRLGSRSIGISQLPVYYLCHTVTLVVLIVFSVFGMRGGATTAIRPITISNANQYVNRPAETGIVLNTPFSIIRTFNKKPFVTPHYLSDEEMEAIYTPVHEACTDAEFRPLNVVVFILESFGKQHFGFYNKDLRNGNYSGFTPFLDSLCTNQALTFEYSYANGRKSIEGMPSVLSSIPNFVEPFFLTPASLNDLSGLARELSENKGYTSAFFHGAENGSMGFQAFAKSTGFQRYYGRTEYNQDPSTGGDDDFDGTWAIWDEEFLQYYAREMNRMQEPFVTAVFTASSHTPFALPERYKNRFPKGDKPIQECVAYSDNALREFFRYASKQKWYDNTIFVITADHTSGNIDPIYRSTVGHYAVPIIIFSPALPELKGYDRTSIVEQTDIMPTVLSLLHYDHPYIAFGQDILNTPAEDKFAIHWVPESDGYEFVKGDYVLQFDGTTVNHAYNLRNDLAQEHDILHSIPADTLQSMERQIKAVIQQYMQRMNGNKLTVR